MLENNKIKPSPKASTTWTLVTVTFNSASTLREFWPRIEPNTTFEWIVVDNASQDDSVHVAAELGARVISLPQNLGFGAANNVGFRNSISEFVAFVNPDITPNPADLSLLGTYLRDHPNNLVSPQLVNGDGTLQPNGRGLPYLLNKVRNRTNPSTLVGSYLRFAGLGEKLPVEWLMGAVVAGSRERFEELGPWDERFFVYYEDADLGLRNSKLSGKSIVLGDARWSHGWARETTNASWSAWKRELPSLMKFYSRYPHLLGFPTRA